MSDTLNLVKYVLNYIIKLRFQDEVSCKAQQKKVCTHSHTATLQTNFIPEDPGRGRGVHSLLQISERHLIFGHIVRMQFTSPRRSIGGWGKGFSIYPILLPSPFLWEESRHD